MSEVSEHTPGPWVVDRDNPYTVRAPLWGDNQVTSTEWSESTPEQAAADARLIAAAPQMLAALRAVYEALPGLPLGSDAAIKVQASIAKAEGRA